MLQWLDSVAGPGYTAGLLWTFAALILLIVVLVAIKLVRSLTFGTFVAGGRNRKTRLAVMDATAVDSHRRLVLVRRDDIEHLLLIGGPTDVVVERDIRLATPRRPALTGEAAAQPTPAPRPRPPQPPQPALVQARPAPPPQPVPARPRQVAPMSRPTEHVHQPPAAPPQPAYGAANGPATRHGAPPKDDSIDDTLMRELEVSLDEPHVPVQVSKPAPKAPATPDDEMTKLLGELSSQKR